MDSYSQYSYWCKNATDIDIQRELRGMQDNDIESSFGGELKFGTAGVRGLIGAGTNRINIYTITQMAAGIAKYAIDRGYTRVVICYDTRLNSKLFANVVACVFASYGLLSYIPQCVMPVPFMSYAVGALKTDFGVMITASHNESRYNGLKLSDSNGVQFSTEECEKVTEYIKLIDPFSIKYYSFVRYLEVEILYIDEIVVDGYISAITSNEFVNIVDNGIKVMYTALNGAGYSIVPRVLEKVGINVELVIEQCSVDMNFSTCKYPNPEREDAFSLGIKYARMQSSDIIIATDSDVDRVGVAVRHRGGYVLLSGNEMGVLLANYLLNVFNSGLGLKKNRLLKPLIIRTIVTTALVDRIVESHNGQTQVVPIGFRHIGKIVDDMCKNNTNGAFVLGFEESYGYLIGTHAKDKDAVMTSMIIALIADYYKGQNKTLVDVLKEIYREYGTYQHFVIRYEFFDDVDKIRNLLDQLRSTPIAIFGNMQVNDYKDYTKQKEGLDLLEYNLTDNTKIIIRPSGTESIIKVYITIVNDNYSNKQKYEIIKSTIDKIFVI